MLGEQAHQHARPLVLKRPFGEPLTDRRGAVAVPGAEVQVLADQRGWVRAFAAWAVAAPEREEWGGDPLVDPLARDFKRWLQVERRLAPRSVNLGLASLDSFFSVLGLGQPRVRCEQLPQAAPRALDQGEQRQLLRAAERAIAVERRAGW